MLALESKHLENLASLQYCTVCIWHKQLILRTSKPVEVGIVLTILAALVAALVARCPPNIVHAMKWQTTYNNATKFYLHSHKSVSCMQCYVL